MTHPSFRTAPRRRGLGAALAWITVASSSCTLASGGTPPEEFDPVVETADATLLFPLPSRVDAGLLRADDVGRHGPLIPPSVIGQPLDNLDALRVNTEADLRLVGLRLDPCSARAGCSPEVRAVFQPLLELDQPTPGVHAADAAVHVFYDVPLDELAAEAEAEAVALLCLEALGLPGADYARGYIQSWYGSGQPLPEHSAQRIFKAADTILRAGRGDEERPALLQGAA